MTIQFNTDKNIHGNDAFTAQHIAQIEDKLKHYSRHLTRIEVHLSDEDGSAKGKPAIRCLLEARMENRQPIIVTHQAETEGQAVNGSLDKMRASLETIVGRLGSH